ncbi:MAG: hypothetical protein ACJ8F3_00210 [Xanthobacteraceae bacterium]
MFEAQYRRLDAPLLGLVGDLQREHPGRMIALIVPEVGAEYLAESPAPAS